MKHQRLIPLLTALCAILVRGASPCAASSAQPDGYPEIRVLSNDDPLFVQQQSEIEESYRLAKTRGASSPPLSIYAYRRRPSQDIFAINARCGLPYDTLATLNNAPDVRTFNSRSMILVPSQPGLFVNNPPRSALEDMMLSSRLGEGRQVQLLVIRRGDRLEPVYFFPGEAFTSVERAYFLRILFQFPIVRGLITSQYGMRKDPFNGHPDFHNGVDIGAPTGTPVHSARDGRVAETGSSAVLGRYILISHPGGYQTVYGHLSEINVTLKQDVAAGETIGLVGATGRATGPHLHFEVRKKGGSTNPFPLLTAKKS